MNFHRMYIDPIDYQDYYEYHGNITIEIAGNHPGGSSCGIGVLAVRF